ncbi:MAG: T9SS type A sorting domain-containing protein [Bacteroidia bacterium]|nr:T9SS type A sorting domain-containing protein [Bacteroidia bacterium]
MRKICVIILICLICGSDNLKARTLWANAEPALQYDDLYICTECGNNKTDVFAAIKEYVNSNNSEDVEESPQQNLLGELNDIVLYPNPTNNILHIKHNFEKATNLRLELYDITGRKIDTWQCVNASRECTVYMQDIAPGNYVYKVYINEVLHKGGKLTIIK